MQPSALINNLWNCMRPTDCGITIADNVSEFFRASMSRRTHLTDREIVTFTVLRYDSGEIHRFAIRMVAPPVWHDQGSILSSRHAGVVNTQMNKSKVVLPCEVIHFRQYGCGKHLITENTMGPQHRTTLR
ncbi:MAG: hypothetical protein BWY76_00816 [bacterium ADurb.Bin429]|nr:MAG: hypothetical protein BWY76_00816 [bacterium ADurb.Bin429]